VFENFKDNVENKYAVVNLSISKNTSWKTILVSILKISQVYSYVILRYSIRVLLSSIKQYCIWFYKCLSSEGSIGRPGKLGIPLSAKMKFYVINTIFFNTKLPSSCLK